MSMVIGPLADRCGGSTYPANQSNWVDWGYWAFLFSRPVIRDKEFHPKFSPDKLVRPYNPFDFEEPIYKKGRGLK